MRAAKKVHQRAHCLFTAIRRTLALGRRTQAMDLRAEVDLHGNNVSTDLERTGSSQVAFLADCVMRITVRTPVPYRVSALQGPSLDGGERASGASAFANQWVISRQGAQYTDSVKALERWSARTRSTGVS